MQGFTLVLKLFDYSEVDRTVVLVNPIQTRCPPPVLCIPVKCVMIFV